MPVTSEQLNNCLKLKLSYCENSHITLSPTECTQAVALISAHMEQLSKEGNNA